jgi:hypothetical protein
MESDEFNIFVSQVFNCLTGPTVNFLVWNEPNNLLGFIAPNQSLNVNYGNSKTPRPNKTYGYLSALVCTSTSLQMTARGRILQQAMQSSNVTTSLPLYFM